MQERDKDRFREPDGRQSDNILFFSSSTPQSQRNIELPRQIDFSASPILLPDYHSFSPYHQYENKGLSEADPLDDWNNGYSVVSEEGCCEEIPSSRGRHNLLPRSMIINGPKTTIKRRQGAGRKTVNPEMEHDVINWVVRYICDHSKLNRNNAKTTRHYQNRKDACQ